MLSAHPGQQLFNISHASDISAARRYARRLSDTLQFDETQAGQLAIVVTEAATNILKHAGDGALFLTPVRRSRGHAVELLVLDSGPGIANLAQSLRDGISTTGTAGTGLGAIKRLSQEFDAYSELGKGAAFYACIHQRNPNALQAEVETPYVPGPSLIHGAICLPLAGEDECGDAWTIEGDGRNVIMLVADGLGHGPEAAQASRAAVQTVAYAAEQVLRSSELQSRSKTALPMPAPALLIDDMHRALRATRGAAAAVATFAEGAAGIEFAGIGNISATVFDGVGRKQLVSHNGIVGHNVRKVQQFSLPWPSQGLFIMCSDGIGTQWDLDLYPGLQFCHPALIAGIIYRDFARDRDDATVLVVRHACLPD